MTLMVKNGYNSIDLNLKMAYIESYGLKNAGNRNKTRKKGNLSTPLKWFNVCGY
jgi:hypothetical protein